MAVRVVDASPWGALLLGEPDGAVVAERLRDVGLIALALLPFEVANVCVKKIRQYPDQRNALMTAFRMLDRMEVDVIEVDHGEALALPERCSLPAYNDAASLLMTPDLWLARRVGADLVTLDRQLAAAVAADL